MVTVITSSTSVLNKGHISSRTRVEPREMVDGIRNDRFIMILDPDGRTESTLRDRVEKIARGENPTVMHQLG